MNNSDLFGGENILEQDLLDNSLLFDANSEELALITSTESSGVPLSSESEEIPFIESVLGDRDNDELNNSNHHLFSANSTTFNYGNNYSGDLGGDVTGIAANKAVVSAEASHPYSASNFAIIAEGTVRVNGKSDFDGEPLDPSDDAFIYGGKGFRINGKPVLPVQRDADGNILEDESHRQILVDNAVAVSEDYHIAEAKAGSRLYSGLTPPQIVETQTVEIPDFSELVDHKLSETIPDGSHEIHLDLHHIWIENQQQWEANFPTPGTADNPTVVRVKNGTLDVPRRVDLSNYVIIVEHGDINFKGKDQDLDNVTLVAENGAIDLGKVNANDSTFLASKSIHMNRQARFAGDSFIANGSGNINFKGATTTTDETDNLVVISAGNITFNGASDTRGQFLAARNFRFNGRSTLYGSIGAKHDIVFNGKSEVIADTIPHVLVEDIEVIEGDAGTQDAVITLNLSQPSIFGIEVDYSTKDGTAVAGEDYQAVSGTVRFSPLKTTQTIVVPIVGDTIDELDEAFAIEFTKISQASLAQKQSTVTIIDDDVTAPEITIAIDDISVQEGDSGTSTAEFTVSLSGSSTLPITVDYSTENNTAIADQDYLSANGTLTFEPGETVKTIQVPIVGDTLDEVDKDFLVNLTNSSNATIADLQGQGTIVDDDEAPGVSINDISAIEGDEGLQQVEFTVSLAQASGKNISVDYSSVDGTAVAGVDYEAVTGTLTFEPGETSQTITVDVIGDTLDEPDEAFSIQLANLTNALATDDIGTGTIIDDDVTAPEITIAIDDVSVQEGDTGTSTAEFTVSLSGSSTLPITVNYSTENDSAIADSDYLAASGTLTFEPGETVKTIQVPIVGDTLDEVDKDFLVNLTNPSNATIADLQGQGTIVDDDEAPGVSIDDVSVVEGDEGVRQVEFTVSLAQASGKTISVDYSSVDGTAVAGVDYEAVAGTLTFEPGETSQTITVDVIGDTLDEPDEVFSIELNNLVNVTVADETGVGTIIDDDDPVNNAPEITSTPDTVFNIETGIYEYDVDAVDPDDDELTYSLVEAPEGMTIDAITGVISWQPDIIPFDSVVPVEVRVEDGRGGFDIQEYQIVVPQVGSGEIRGFKWEDINRNGIQDIATLTQDITVEGTDVIFLAGRDDVIIPKLGETNAKFPLVRRDFINPGFSRESFPDELIADAGDVFTFDVSGGVSFGGSTFGLDGRFFNRENISSLGGISGYQGVEDVLVGVFLTDENPANSTPPPVIPIGDLNPVGLTLAFDTLTPEIGQIFFIGDGINNLNGQNQQFIAPEGATRLYLGVPEGDRSTSPSDPFEAPGFYEDNEGAYSITVNRQINEAALSGVTVYIDENQNGTLDNLEPFQVTSEDDPSTSDVNETGQYTFTNLSAATYTVREVIPDGFEQTFPLSGEYAVDLSPNSLVENINFGNVLSNNPPNILRSPEKGFDIETGSYQYDVDAFDRDGDVLTYSLVEAPEGMIIDPATGVIDWQPETFTFASLVPVEVRVDDGNGGFDVQQYDIEIPESPATIRGLKWNDLNGNGVRDFQFIQGVNPDVIFALDTSGSAGSPFLGTPIGDFNGNGFGNEIIDAEIAALIALNQQLIAQGKGDSANIVVIPFGNGRADAIDLDPATEGIQISATPNQDNNNNGIPDVEEALRSVQVAGGTDLRSPVSTAVEVFNQLGTAPGDGNLIYLSDGEGGANFTDLVDILNANEVNVSAFGVGNSSRLELFQNLDPDAQIIRNTDDLLEAFVSLGSTQEINAEPGLAGVSIYLDTNNNGILDPDEPVTTTVEDDPSTPEFDETGEYKFTNLLPGTYTVREVVPEDFIQTAPLLNTNQDFYSVEIVRFETVRDINFGNDALNNAPLISSTPDTAVNSGINYIYNVEASDVDGDRLSYQLIESPTEMTINQATGLIEWTPSLAQVGSYEIQILVSDGEGGEVEQSYTLEVLENPNNQAPVISSEPLVNAVFGNPYTYDVEAVDPDGEVISYSLNNAPDGMVIDNEGVITWNPTITDLGNYAIEVVVTDSRGLSTTQTYNLSVTEDTQAPEINFEFSDNQVDVGGDITFTVSAIDNVGVENVTLEVNGNPVALDSQGMATVTFDNLGEFEVVARAVDDAGNITEKTQSILVIDSSDTEAPVVDLISYLGGTDFITEITAPTGVIGTVTDDNLLFYTLSVAPVGTEDFREIFRGTNTITNGNIGTFDPSIFLNDAYDLQLSATDAGGNTVTDEVTVNVAGDLKLGNFQLSFTDMTIPVTGIPIQVTRTYDSFNANNADDFGFGWRLEFRDTDLRTSLGTDPQIEEQGNASRGFRDEEKVYITLPGGERETFIFRPTQSRFSPYFEPNFEADEGVTSTLTVRNANLVKAGDEYVDFFVNSRPYNPAAIAFGQVYTLTTKEGIEYRINGLTGDLETVTDRNGNVLTFTDNGISSSTGKNVTFERDTQGRIERVIDPEGNAVSYGYDAAGDLVSVTDRESNVTRFEYDEEFAHYLDEVIDPLGRSGVRSEYDDLGRLRQLIDADGELVELIYDPDNSIQQVKDQLGNITTFEYDDRGNVLREIDPDGGIITRSYDDNNNVLTETVLVDTNGKSLTTTFTYDGNRNVLTERDLLNNTTTYTYDDFSNILTTEDASGIIVTNTYNPDNGNLTQISGQPNGTLTFEYDDNGNIESFEDANGSILFDYNDFGDITRQTDAEGTVTTFEYNNNGNTISETTTRTLADGTVATLVTLMEYDSENRLIKTTNPENYVTVSIYDAAGQKIQDIDKLTAAEVAGLTVEQIAAAGLGRSTKYRYDDRGLLIETIFADDTPGDDDDNPRTKTEYDARGLVTAEIDELDRKTEYRYDDLGRQIATIFPDNTPGNLADNPQTQTVYDLAGRRIAEIDERGNRTTFIYDDAGRLETTILPDDTPDDEDDNPRFTTTYDAAGRQETQTDAENNTTTFSYDVLGRPDGQEFADNTTTITDYDDSGRVVARTDQDGEVTRFEYDDLGRLTAVIDPLGTITSDPNDFRTEYGYDEQGNLITQTDANDNVTRYEYDNLGRRIAVVLPEGQRSAMAYDEVGNLISMTDFNGVTTTYSYDERDRLVSESFSDDTPSITHTYFDNGLKATVTDERGITRFTYDVRNRLTSRIDPDGTTIAYSYDIAGNRTEVTIPSGDTTYTYDAQNRIKTVTDPDNGITEYFYSPNSNLERTEFANGTLETREYDDLNRLEYIQTTDSNSNIISSFRYTLDAEGNRTQVEEQDGRIVQYEYDDNDRLTQETIFAPGATVATQTIEYAYDEAGNRLSRVDSAEGTTIYTYDNNDRLQNETTDGVATTYTYDDNGNTITKTTAGNTVTYDWDAKNRLVAADTDGDGTNDVVNQYNENGIRVSQTANGEETRYLIDANRPYAQVLEEYTEGGIIKVSYVYGNDLISQDRDGDRSFYHIDGLGSTRALTHESGILTDSYTYDAFGNVLTQVGSTENSYLYAGEQRDSNLGLDYLRARYLDTSTGRFVSRDSFEGFQNNPISLNKYLYGNANPVSNIDPSGLTSILSLTSIAALQGLGGYLTLKNILESENPGEELAKELIINLFAFPIGGIAIRGIAKRTLKIANSYDFAQSVSIRLTKLGNNLIPRISTQLNSFDTQGNTLKSFAPLSIIRKRTLNTKLVAFRAENIGDKVGRFLSTNEFLSPKEAEKLFNINRFGNKAQKLSIYEIPQGTTVFFGRVAGGTGNQIFVQNPNILKKIGEKTF